MGKHQIEEMEVRLYGHGRHEVEMKLYNATAYTVSLLPGIRELMPDAEIGILPDGRTHWLFNFDSDAPELTTLIDYIKSHPGHYDVSSN